MELMCSGLNIGRDIMGTMANTLVLAYVGSSLHMILLLLAYNNDVGSIINRETIAVELLQSVAGSIGILLTVPSTAAVTVLARRWLPEPCPAPAGGRSHRRRSPAPASAGTGSAGAGPARARTVHDGGGTVERIPEAGKIMAECPEKTGSSCHDEVDLPKKLFYFYAVNGIITSERAQCALASAGTPAAALSGRGFPEVRCSPENRTPFGGNTCPATWPGGARCALIQDRGRHGGGAAPGRIKKQNWNRCGGTWKRLMNEDTV